MTSTHQLGFFGKLARAVLANRAATVVFLVLTTIIAGYFTSKLHVDSDILTLMPEDEPSTKALKRLDEEEGGVNFLTIAVEAEDKEKRDAFLGDLAGRLRALPDTEYVLYELDPDTTFRIGILQLPTSDLVTIRDRLQAAIALGPAASNPFIAARLLDLGPLTDRLGTTPMPLSLGGSDQVGRMVVRPKGSAHDIPFSRRYMAEVHTAIEAAGATIPVEAEDSAWRRAFDRLMVSMGVAEAPKTEVGSAGVTIKWIGGAYRHNVEDYEGIVRDIGWITVASFLMVLVIIGAAFRTPRSLAIIFIPLLMSNVWTLGIAGGTVGSLNSFTSFVNAVLIGLGVEFGVHLYARYREIRVAGHSTDESIVRAWDLVGGACTSAALTAAAGFAALLAAHFAGFRQLGWLLSLGLMFCLLGELLAMPLVIQWLDHDNLPAHEHRKGHRARRRRPSSYRLAPMALLVIGSFTLVSALFIPRIEFEYDLSELRRSGLSYQDLSEAERALARESYAPMIVSYGSAAELDAAYARIRTRVEKKKFPEIASVLSIRTIIPADQEEKLTLLREIVGYGKDANAAYLPAQVRQNIARLASVPLEPLQPTDLPVAVQHILGAANGKHRLLLVPSGNMWDMREASKLAYAIERELPNLEVGGEYLTLGVLYRLMQRDAPIIGVIAFGLVLLFTWLDLRSVRATAGAIAVLIAGVAWWGALLVGSGIKISIINFVGIPIVLGIGIDVMIHLIHRMQQEGPGRIQRALATTGWASALGTLTTVVAFAALSLASSRGVQSLGLLVLLGEVAVTIAGFVLVPLGFATAWRLQGRHPNVEDTNPGTHPPGEHP